VFLVLYAIHMFVFLNNLVIVLLYFHMYVNVANFRFCVMLGVVYLFLLVLALKCVSGRLLLFCNTCIIFMCCSSWYLFPIEMDVLILLSI
jgi:hypothetical protein